MAQDKKPVFRDYDWGGKAEWDPQWDRPSTGTEVLDDALSIRIKNTKPQYIALFFERRQVIRFGTEEEIMQYSRFTLPESLDPSFDERLTPWSERVDRPRPNWFNVRLDEFAARIVRPDGTWGEVGVFASVDRNTVRTVATNETAWTYVLDMQAIAPGDVVEVHWKYMVPYNSNLPAARGWRAYEWMDNWARLTSWRVFFHGEVPIRHQRIEFRYDLKHGLVLGGEPPMGRSVKGNAVTAVWLHRELPGCMDEVNARPGTDLPHITVLFAPEDGRYFRQDRLSGMLYPQPYWLQVVRKREARAAWWRQVSRKRIPDRQNQLIKAFVKEASIGVPDSLTARRMERVHERIAQWFSYKDDNAWYDGLDQGLARIGEQVRDQLIRDISRYDMYSKLLNQLRLDHSTAYVLDKRIGSLTDLYLTPLWDSEFLFLVRDDDGLLLMHPKRTRMGWLANELPFYWEGSSALLVNLPMLLQDIPSPPVFIDLPTDLGANLRRTEIDLRIDPMAGTATASARVFLSGQFSTLCRGAYAFGTVDSTVMPVYGHRLQDAAGVRTVAMKVGDLQTDPPFRQVIELELDLSAGLHKSDDGIWTIDLKGLLEHAVPNRFTAAGRDLPFYWDFEQDDRYTLNVELPDGFAGNIPDQPTGDVASSGASYHFRMERSDETAMRITSQLLVHEVREPADRAADLEELLSRAFRASSLQLTIRSTTRPGSGSMGTR